MISNVVFADWMFLQPIGQHNLRLEAESHTKSAVWTACSWKKATGVVGVEFVGCLPLVLRQLFVSLLQIKQLQDVG